MGMEKYFQEIEEKMEFLRKNNTIVCAVESATKFSQTPFTEEQKLKLMVVALAELDSRYVLASREMLDAIDSLIPWPRSKTCNDSSS